MSGLVIVAVWFALVSARLIEEWRSGGPAPVPVSVKSERTERA